MIQRKVCLVGDFAVGKTSLFNRFIYNRFSPEYLSTLGVRIQRRVVSDADLTLLVWDIEGGREGSVINANYLGGAVCVVLVCDLLRSQTIVRCTDYAEQLRRDNPNLKLVMAANKLDVVAVDHAHVALAQQVAAQLQVPLTLTSAVDGTGVQSLFRTVGARITAVDVMA